VISMFIDEAKIQSDLSQMIQKGGLHKQQATRASQVSAEVVDDYARKIFSSTPYTYGSSDTHLNGNQVSYMLNKSKNLYIPRKRWRKWASKKYSVKFETKKNQKTDFWHRSMVKFRNGGRGNPSTLAHLIEFGAENKKARRKNRALNLKKTAFEAKRRKALLVLEKGLAIAVINATHGTKMGLIKFRKQALR
jgi:hypothetical protein